MGGHGSCFEPGMPMFHTACPTFDHALAFSDLPEGADLFRRVAAAAGSRLVALCVMPDHVHLITTEPVRSRLRGALSGYTRARNHRLGRRGRLFAGVPEALERRGGVKELRDQRYVELNPCRAGLVSDPLAWPLSTWRDRMGFAWPPVRPRARDVARWHAYATRDDYVVADPLPYRFGEADPHDLVGAVSSLMRLPTWKLRERGPARTLLVASLRWSTSLSAADIGDLVGLTGTAVRRVPFREVPGVGLVEQVAGDPRFVALEAMSTRFDRYVRRQRRDAMGAGAAWG